jgi:hypothetical protein
MPTLVHLADLNDAEKIKRNGIKIHRYRRGIFCMPVTPDFYVTHQWIRELRRRGVRTYVGVYFKLPDDEPVYAGKYFEEHKPMALAEAIRELNSLNDPLGYQVIVERKILPAEIVRIKKLPQIVGWRVSPDAKGSQPCGCRFCQLGRIKGSRIVERFSIDEKLLPYNEIISQLKQENDEDAILRLLDQVRQKTRHRDPAELLFLLEKNLATVDKEFAYVLGVYKHKNVRLVAEKLLESSDEYTRENATEILEKLASTTTAH